MESVQITTLPNGVRVVTDPMPTVESVSVGVWVRAGARFEPVETNGVAHLLEHMMFKGTARRTAPEIAESIENVGGHINAYTAREVTAYYAKVLKDDVALAVDVIADIVQNSLFDEAELTRERSVVLQEIGQAHDTPDDIVFDQDATKGDQEVEIAGGEPLSDQEIQALWLRRLQTEPADFLKSKFSFQNAQQGDLP